ncbi:hypothetical protein K503DRAFT_178499 [Rhizopogon vinicolor AM-OR11-026]|uniref:Uncharacterized protein n=1 Tax=Rhizopogon vinicolor AM-OR11-026 TaxID=1314800 RepID=A0A1B7MDS9_9AGAM|nr:hypothetical protein K503DRAFT_178499 [Rhizopogon vinicolor AM-OR11-026]
MPPRNAPTTPPKSSSAPTRLTKAATVHDKLLNSNGSYYAATPKLAYSAEFFVGGRQGNALIAKGRDTDEEFIIRGVFQIAHNDFYFTPDANFDSANVF